MVFTSFKSIVSMQRNKYIEFRSCRCKYGGWVSYGYILLVLLESQLKLIEFYKEGNRESGCPFLISSRGDGAAEPRASAASAVRLPRAELGEINDEGKEKRSGGVGRTRICNDIVYLDGDLLIHRLRGPPSPLEKAIGGEGEARGDGSAAEWGKTAFFSTFVCQIM